MEKGGGFYCQVIDPCFCCSRHALLGRVAVCMNIMV